MNSRYKFNFSKCDFLNKSNNQTLPEWCTYSMGFANYHHHYCFREMEFFGTRYEYKPFVIDLIQINSFFNSPFYFEISKSQTILFIMLEGEISGGLAKLDNLNVHSGEFIFSNYELGKYKFQPNVGKHSFLIITIDNDWFKIISKDLNNIIANNFENDLLYGQVFLCKASREAHQWIRNIYNFYHQNIGAIDGNLRMHITFILEYYNKKIEIQKGSLAFKIKSYLDEHYSDNNLNVKNLAEYFYVTERTLRNHFARQFRKTIHRYYTELRMKHANELINNGGLSAKDIYFQIGYNDESSFRYAYTHYLKKHS